MISCFWKEVILILCFFVETCYDIVPYITLNKLIQILFILYYIDLIVLWALHALDFRIIDRILAFTKFMFVIFSFLSFFLQPLGILVFDFSYGLRDNDSSYDCNVGYQASKNYEDEGPTYVFLNV